MCKKFQAATEKAEFNLSMEEAGVFTVAVFRGSFPSTWSPRKPIGSMGRNGTFTYMNGWNLWYMYYVSSKFHLSKSQEVTCIFQMKTCENIVYIATFLAITSTESAMVSRQNISMQSTATTNSKATVPRMLAHFQTRSIFFVLRAWKSTSSPPNVRRYLED